MGELPKVCSRNLHEQSQKWTRACDKRLARLISCIHNTSEFKPYCRVETQHNNADWDHSKTLILLDTFDFGENFVHFWQSHIRSHGLDVRETNVSFTQFDTISGYFSWCKFYAWMAREMVSPRHVHGRRRRTREGPEPECVRSPCGRGVAHAGKGKGELTSCRGTVHSAW